MLRILCLIIALWSASAQADAPEDYPFLSFDKAMQKAADEGKPVFVYFGRYGCGYCEKTNKETFTDPTVRQRYISHYVLAYVDAESGRRLRLPSGERITESELGPRYKAFVTPVFTFLDAKGETLLRLVGVQRIEDMLDADARVQALLNAEGKP